MGTLSLSLFVKNDKIQLKCFGSTSLILFSKYINTHAFLIIQCLDSVTGVSRMFKNCRMVLQVVSGVMTLCLLVGSQAPQHLRSSGGQSTCGGCFGYQSNSLVVFFDASESRTVEPQEPWKTDVRHWPHASLYLPFHSSLLNRMHVQWLY